MCSEQRRSLRLTLRLPRRVLAMYNKAIADAQRETFERFFTTSPTRFYLPEDDYTFFDTVFTAFEKADSNAVRVVHYGDSQIEIDRVTHVIRDTLQKMFEVTVRECSLPGPTIRSVQPPAPLTRV